MYDAFPSQILHGNSAKVWVLSESSIANDKSVTALENYRKTYIFFANERFREQELIHLGSKKGLIGRYDIRNDHKGGKVLCLYFQDGHKEFFSIQGIDNYNLTLQDYENQATLEFHSLKSPKL